jgi:uncharacterized SAM-binding protein YcdF (DUF218 family)
MWKGLKRFVLGFSVVFTATVLIVAFTGVAGVLARPLIVRPDVRKVDLIVVLGGGAYENGVLGESSNERLVHGLLLYRDGYASAVLFVGGTIASPAGKIARTVLKSEAAAPDVVESSIMRDIAARLGMPADALLAETASTDTYRNIKAVKQIMERWRFKECLLVTSPTHMKRTLLAAEKLGLRCYPAPVEDYTPHVRISAERIELMRLVVWEYAGIALYRLYGYI